jgi:hypothetical protein
MAINSIPLDEQSSDLGGGTQGQTPGSIRNIIQTVGEREVVKTAPDIIIYLDGLPYIRNKYLTQSESVPYVLVNFNDHVVSFNASYDTDQFVPSCSFSLSVPNHLKYLYQTPGGNNALETMMELQVFAKGYYFSSRGNSVYRRIFKGLVKSISTTDKGTNLDITVSGLGIMHFFELMRTTLNPAAHSNSAAPQTGYTTYEHNMDPYNIIKHTFVNFDFNQSFQTGGTADTVNGGLLINSDYKQAIELGFVSKWQKILENLSRNVHIFGIKDFSNFQQDSSENHQQTGEYASEHGKKHGTTKESEFSKNLVLDGIRKHLPDHGLSTLHLFNQNIVSRLERIRTYISLVGFEGYQDIDGSIIIKPPLYNLDVLNLNFDPEATTTSSVSHKIITGDPSSDTPSSDTSIAPSVKTYTDKIDISKVDISEANNPFVVYLSEISGESEVEDESAIRLTRMMVKGVPSVHFPGFGNEELVGVAEYIDIPKLARFGVREERAKIIPWIKYDNKLMLFAMAVYELIRGNKGFRQYSFTMPLKPELKLGFPMYIPHKDMYGYIKSVSINYQVGGSATMNVSLDTIRRRPMYPSSTKGKNGVDIYVTQPNVVYKWTKAASNVPADVTKPKQVPFSSKTTAAPSDIYGIEDTQSDAILDGQPASLPTGKPTQTQLSVNAYRDTKIKGFLGNNPDDDSNHYRVQPGDGYFSKENAPTVDYEYLSKIKTTLPYTDDNGYEVVAPFPWGRYTGLKQAIALFTQGSSIVGNSTRSEPQLLSSATDSFLFAGLGTPSGDLSPGGILDNELNKISDLIESDSVFELSYTQGEDKVVNSSSPEKKATETPDTTQDDVDTATVFVTGQPGKRGP